MGIRVFLCLRGGTVRNGRSHKECRKTGTEDMFFALNADTFYQIDCCSFTELMEEKDLDMVLFSGKFLMYPAMDRLF